MKNSGTFVISCENWLGGAAGTRGVGFTKGADGADVKVFIKTNTSSELLLTIEGGRGGGGHA